MPFLKGISNIKSKWEVRSGKMDNEVGGGNNLTSHFKNPASHFSPLTSKLGFTLIELLVVMTIIAILIAAVSASFTNAQMKSRDGKRKSDLKSVQQALEIYMQRNGKYPDTSVGKIRCNTQEWNGTDWDDVDTREIEWGAEFFCDSTSSGNPITYSQQLPKDPSGITDYNDRQSYFYDSTSPFSYSISASLENSNDPDIPNIPCSPMGTRNYCVINP